MASVTGHAEGPGGTTRAGVGRGPARAEYAAGVTSAQNSCAPLHTCPPLRVVRLDRDLPLPARAHDGDAGIDLYSTTDLELAPGRRQLVGTGIAVALPHGTVGLVHPRSGLAARAGLSIVNAPGTVDAGYRGEIKVCLLNTDPESPIVIARGDRIAQFLVQRVELPEVVEVDELDETARGSGGYGSSGGHALLTTPTGDDTEG